MVTQLDALNTTAGALKLKPEHAALIEAARRLAEALDIDENAGNAALWARYQEAINALHAAAPNTGEDDGSATLLELVRPKIRNAKNAGKKDARPRRRSDSPVVEHAADAVAAPRRRRGSGASA